MSEEIAHIIEDTNDEDVENWIYYDNDNKSDTTSVTNILNNDTEQLIYDTDPPELIINSGNDDDDDDNQEYQFDNQFDVINESEITPSDEDDNAEDGQIVNEVLEEQFASLDNEDEFSKHTLILKETINDSGQVVDGYFCEQCNVPYDTIEAFLQSHPCTEFVNIVDNLNDADDKKPDSDIIEIQDATNSSTNTKEDGDNSASAVDLDEERYFCYECEQVFTDLTMAEQHDCSNQVETNIDLTEEAPSLLVETSGKVYKCKLCNKNYPSIRSFSNHQRWHTRSATLKYQTKIPQKQPVVCVICNTIFESEKNLKLHMKMHKKHSLKSIQDALPVGAQNEYNGLNQFFCEICNKSFDQKLLDIHKNMHQNVEEYNCNKCNRQFENLPSYEIHLQMHSAEMHSAESSVKIMSPSKQLNSLIVNTESPSTSSNNASGGSGQRKHACQYCGKEFQRPYEKVKHERIHTGEKPYECEVCGKTFRVSYSLTLHLRTHTDIRPYVCPTCNKRFKQQSVYVHHLKTHEIERAYKCDVCGKSFRTSVQLSGHKKSHSKPFNCTDCNRPFASMYAVKLHMKTHNKTHRANKNLKNRCNICGASYARLFALRYHLQDHHDVDIDPSQLLDMEVAESVNMPKDIDVETAILMEAANQANDHIAQQQNYLKGNEEEDNEEINVMNDEVVENQIDHEENIQQSVVNDSYLDETVAATQTILNDEIIVDSFSAEEIITDWLSK